MSLDIHTLMKASVILQYEAQGCAVEKNDKTNQNELAKLHQQVRAAIMSYNTNWPNHHGFCQ